MRWRNIIRVAAAMGLVPVGVSISHGQVLAVTIDVTTTADEVSNNGETSLREAIIAANGGAGADVVTVPAGNYALTICDSSEDFAASGDLDVRNEVTIRGSGVVTIDQMCGERVFDVFGTSPVTFERVTITGGQVAGSFGGGGGGIAARFDEANVIIRDSVITGNAAGDNGAGDAGSGGGVFVKNNGTLLIERSTISDNSVGTGGPSVLGWKAGGGGVAFRGFSMTPGTVTITDSTISGNTGGVAARGGGGGLWLDALEIDLTNVDIVENSLPAGEAAAGNGAGIAIAPVQPADIDVDIVISGGTMSANTVGVPAGGDVTGGDGGGLYLMADGGDLEITGTTFDGNSAGDGAGAFRGGNGGNGYIVANTTSSIDQLSVDITDAKILNGRAGGSSGGSGGNGGGMYIVAGSFAVGSTISVTGATFDGNSAGAGSQGGAGGGLYARSTTSNVPGRITVTNSDFSENHAGDGVDSIGGDGGAGGGAWLFVDNTGGPVPAVSVSGAAFDANSSGDGGGNGAGTGGFAGLGGGVALYADTSSVSDSEFTGNRSGIGGSGSSFGRPGARGGGAYLTGGETAINDSTFSGNTTGSGGSGDSASGAGGGDGAGAYLRMTRAADLAETMFDGNATGRGGNGPNSAGPGGEGGGLAVDLQDGGVLELTDVTLSSNTTGDGGESSGGAGAAGGFGGGLNVRADSGDVTLTRVAATSNATGDGGTGVTALSAVGGYGAGLFTLITGTDDLFTMSDSVFADNIAGGGGSATGSGNPGAIGGQGAGIWASVGAETGQNGRISVSSSSITGNVTGDGGLDGPSGGIGRTSGYGGGAYLVAGPGASGLVEVENTTVADNANGGGDGSGGRGDGAGVYVHIPTKRVALEYVTLTGNRGRNGENFMTLAGRTDVSRSVIGEANPGDDNGGENCNNVSGGPIVSGGYNIETGGNSCAFGATGDAFDVDNVVLGPLQDNGGVGLSRLPVLSGAGAPLVLDRVPSASCNNNVDQLGTTRPAGSGCDVGAVEADPSAIEAVDDVLAVGGGTTTLNFLDNDDLQGFTPTDTSVRITKQPADGVVFQEDGVWSFRSPQIVASFTSFTYEACLGLSGLYCDTAEVTLVPEGLSRFVPLSPNRLFDTRPGEPAAGPKGFVAGDTEIDVQVTGVAGVPATGVSAIAMNVTATQVEGPGFVTAYPTGSARPLSSNLNFTTPGDTIPNFVVVPVGAGGKVTLYTLSGTHLLADVAGYFTEAGISENAASPGSTSGRLIPLSPTRAFDTRPDEPASGPKGLVAGDSTIDVQIAGRAGVPTTGVSAVVMNLTATATQAPGFVTAFPKGAARPTASNVNITGPGQTAPNLVIVPLGDNGQISLYTLSALHLIGDVTGYFTTGSAPRSLSGLFAPSDPRRALDTREGEAPPGSKGFLADGETRSVRFTANAGVPATGAGAVMMNATATGAAAPGFVTAWPQGVPRPTASTLNLSFAGQTRPNAAVLPIGQGGEINFYSLRGVDLLADVFGWFLE